MSQTDTPDAPSDDSGDRYNVPALERGLRLLCEFSRDTPTLSAPELARRFNLPRSTVFRLLSTLENMGFIEKTESGRDYRLGLAVLRLGFEYLASLELTELGLPVLTRLSEDIGHACNMVVRDGRSIVYVAKTASPTPFRSAVTVGTRLPAHATVLGHVLLADLSLPQLRALYPEDKLEVFSDNTPRTVNALFDMVQTVRDHGYVLGEGFFESNISTIAAPVRDRAGHTIAALGATFTTAHIDEGPVDQLVNRVRAAADEISGLLDGAHPGMTRKVIPLRR
ncbi:IclR family transcriptional regulator [Pseudacidovorax sp. NFM-22]|uniref:IclR family transcriptional regulator n=1 Tax=Pseudacidovorax sp. NFM-22 TaxID=2744469 RepID=UPI001B17C8A6|nr:IclR family transcriptional regulator [Pseudacidovorax sp. NFM-22]MBO9646243.1 IclR family transcriptional regulator [Pseudacidovorax sp.]